MRLACLVIALAACSEAERVRELWVAPDGDDANPGTERAPLRTLARARDAIRAGPAGRAIVTLSGGRYELAETLELSARDQHITFRAAPGETPVVSGGRFVGVWEPAGIGIVTTSFPDDVRMLWIDGRFAPRARGPAPRMTRTATGYITDEPLEIAIPQLVELGFTTTWSHKTCGVAAIEGTAITMEQPCFDLVTRDFGSRATTPAYLENAIELADEAGEWVSVGGTIYLRSPATSTEAIVPVLEQLVVLRGARDIRFEGITFADTTFLRPATYGHPDVQANFVMDTRDRDTLVEIDGLYINDRYAYWKTRGAVVAGGTRDVAFERCTFTRLGGSGLDVERGARNTTIEGNRFVDIAANAIQIGDVLPDDHHPARDDQILRDTRVANNVIRRAGIVFEDSVGIFVGFTQRTVVAHNDIAELPYTGISVGWGWGDLDAGGNPTHPFIPWRYQAPTIARDNEVVANHVHDIMRTRMDGGGIYTTGAQPGMRIADNHVQGATGWFGGVYLDQGSAQIEVTNNSVHDVPDAYYTDNVVPETLASCNEHDNHFDREVDVGAGLEPGYRDLLP